MSETRQYTVAVAARWLSFLQKGDFPIAQIYLQFVNFEILLEWTELGLFIKTQKNVQKKEKHSHR